MIELSRVIQTTDGVLVPKGVRLKFANGVAKYLSHPIRRELLPLECIVGAKGPFLNACCATVLNNNAKFQAERKTRYQDWMHFVIHGDALIIYVWDTREVVEVITGMYQAIHGKPVTKTLVNKQTGERMVKTIANPRFGWAKQVYEVVLRGIEHRPDNGLPLKTNNPEWKDIIDKFNNPIKTKFAYESLATYASKLTIRYTQSVASILQKHDAAFVTSEPWLRLSIVSDGKQCYYSVYMWDSKESICSGTADTSLLSELSDACKADIIKTDDVRLIGDSQEVKAMNAMSGIEATEGLSIVPAQGIGNTHIVLLNGQEVARITSEDLRMAKYGDDSQFDGLKTDKVEDGETSEDFESSDDNAEDANMSDDTDTSEDANNSEYENDSDTEDDEQFEDADKSNDDETSNDESSDEEPTEDAKPITTAAYANVGKCKLTVIDNSGQPIELKCLRNDIVTEQELLDDLAKHFKL